MKKYFEVSNKIEGVNDQHETDYALMMFNSLEKRSLEELMYAFHLHLGHLNHYCTAGKLRDYAVYVGDVEAIKMENIENELFNLFKIYDLSQKGIKKIDFLWIKNWHIQFEKIHPFGDGNGRVGRLLMAMQCREANCLQELKEFFLHAGFHGMRSEYYQWFK